MAISILTRAVSAFQVIVTILSVQGMAMARSDLDISTHPTKCYYFYQQEVIYPPIDNRYIGRRFDDIDRWSTVL